MNLLRQAFVAAYPKREAQACAADRALRSAQDRWETPSELPEVIENLTSLQPLTGAGLVLVCFSSAGPHDVDIEGVLHDGELVDACQFSAGQLDAWRCAIVAEQVDALEQDRIDAVEVLHG